MSLSHRSSDEPTWKDKATSGILIRPQDARSTFIDHDRTAVGNASALQDRNLQSLEVLSIRQLKHQSTGTQSDSPERREYGAVDSYSQKEGSDDSHRQPGPCQSLSNRFLQVVNKSGHFDSSLRVIPPSVFEFLPKPGLGQEAQSGHQGLETPFAVWDAFSLSASGQSDRRPVCRSPTEQDAKRHPSALWSQVRRYAG